MTTSLKIVALGNAVTDLVAEVDDALLQELGLKNGSHNIGDNALKEQVAQKLPNIKALPGGSMANTIYGLGHLGADVTLISSIADDDVGRAFLNSMHDAGVQTRLTNFGNDVQSQTGYVFVAPNGERTFVNLPYNTRITPDIVDIFADSIINADILLIEGYLFIDQTDAVDRALELARENGVKIGMTLAAENVVINFHDVIAKHIMDGIDLLVANDEELAALIDGAGHDEALAQAIEATARVVTRGGDGSSYINPALKMTVEASTFPLDGPLMDTNGAGDGFLAGFLCLYSFADDVVVHAMHVAASLGLGAAVASQVICQVGPRLPEEGYVKAALLVVENNEVHVIPRDDD